MLPIVDEILWACSKDRARPLARENAGSVKSAEYGSRIFSDGIWGKNPSTANQNTAAGFAALLLSTLVVILYAPVLRSLERQWLDDPNYGHGIFVPIFAAYVLWCERDRWCAQPIRANDFGLAIMLFAVGLLVLGTLGAETFTTRLSLLILICGIVVLLAGYRMLRSIAFPVGYLVFMIPLPAIVY